MNLQEATIKKILEAKQVGTIYHYTDIEGLNGIASTNTLSGAFGRQCFTRNNHLLNQGNSWSVKSDVKIIVDGDLLSEKYSVTPFQDWCDKDDEQEERIYTKDIPNFNRYVIGVEIYHRAYNHFRQKVKNNMEYYKRDNLRDRDFALEYGETYNGYYDFDKDTYNTLKFYKDTIDLCKKVFKNVKEV